MRRVALACLVLLALVGPSCRGRGPLLSPSEVVVVPRDTVPNDPADVAWNAAPVHPAALILQDLVDPRLLEPSTTKVRVQAITDGSRVAFRLSWADPTKDDLPGPARFPDACAVQLPAKVERDVPAPQMGEAGKPVEITFWRATWQAAVDGRRDAIEEIYPGAAVGHYPFDAPSLPSGSPEQQAMTMRYAPARALGNRMAGPRDRPVEDLVAEGPGTIHPAPATRSKGRGRRTETGWEVIISRPLPEGLRLGGRSQVAFAVWQGAHGEAGARKMRSAWIPITVEGKR